MHVPRTHSEAMTHEIRNPTPHMQVFTKNSGELPHTSKETNENDNLNLLSFLFPDEIRTKTHMSYI